MVSQKISKEVFLQVIEHLRQQYLQDNNLQAVSDLYMTSIRNHWVTNDNGSYLNKLSVKVKKITVEF